MYWAHVCVCVCLCVCVYYTQVSMKLSALHVDQLPTDFDKIMQKQLRPRYERRLTHRTALSVFVLARVRAGVCMWVLSYLLDKRQCRVLLAVLSQDWESGAWQALSSVSSCCTR